MARPEKGRRTAQSSHTRVEQVVAENNAPPYKPGLNSAGTDALYLSFALRLWNGWGGKNSGFYSGNIFINTHHFVLSHHKNLVLGFLFVCAPFRAFFTASIKKQILTLAPKVRCNHAACLPQAGNRRRTFSPRIEKDADASEDTPNLLLRQNHGQLVLMRPAHQLERRPFFFQGVGGKEPDAARR
ncbi:MAG: hypothetical protein GXP14_11940 [Gammaproteobacteria bacterium]|nr:hypothetical protein [Gammaproteobacteria bacterium]